jgi:hypothetical protein
LQDRGAEALEKPQRSRYAELRELVKSQPGREEFREELLTMVMMIVELGIGELRETADGDESIFSTPVIKVLGLYMNTAARLIDSFPKSGAQSSIQVELKRIDKVVKEATSQGEESEVLDALEAPENAPEPAMRAENGN